MEWDVIERMPCRIKLLPIEKGAAAFHDFEEYERLVDVARAITEHRHLRSKRVFCQDDRTPFTRQIVQNR